MDTVCCRGESRRRYAGDPRTADPPTPHGATCVAVTDGPAPTGTDTGAGPGGSPDPEVESVVFDLTALSAADIDALPDSVLGTLLRRVYDGCAEGTPFVTGHNEGI